jgi:hypothetical protein
MISDRHHLGAQPGSILEVLKDSILFAALFRVFSFLPACISWGFLTIADLEGEGATFMPNYRIVDQASVFTSPGDRNFQPHGGRLVSILVASSDKRRLRWGYSCSQPQHGKIINVYRVLSSKLRQLLNKINI